MCDREGKIPEARAAGLVLAPYLAERQGQAGPEHQGERWLLDQTVDKVRRVSAAAEDQARYGVVKQDVVGEKERVLVVTMLVLGPQHVVLFKVDDGRRIGLRQDVGANGLEGLGRQHPINDGTKGEFAPIVIAIATADAVVPVGVQQLSLRRDRCKFACHDAIFDQFGDVKQRAKVSSIGVETASKLTTCYPAGFDRRHLE
ncbi:hypothetical protein AAE485_07710 [Acidithiobacillus ferriphilus]|uniref:hypothetical protein n=1 Tax=Acidithiobacillus ferriphilus TaxID=1689834 RepID=UPI002DB7F44E|nr:hypothetical protein [Acidithiobacillus ferriphilus]MEB8475507.1 hypothetical protein [Acidithiobacillus ferriphilus]